MPTFPTHNWNMHITRALLRHYEAIVEGEANGGRLDMDGNVHPARMLTRPRPVVIQTDTRTESAWTLVGFSHHCSGRSHSSTRDRDDGIGWRGSKGWGGGLNHLLNPRWKILPSAPLYLRGENPSNRYLCSEEAGALFPLNPNNGSYTMRCDRKLQFGGINTFSKAAPSLMPSDYFRTCVLLSLFYEAEHTPSGSTGQLSAQTHRCCHLWDYSSNSHLSHHGDLTFSYKTENVLQNTSKEKTLVPDRVGEEIQCMCLAKWSQCKYALIML